MNTAPLRSKLSSKINISKIKKALPLLPWILPGVFVASWLILNPKSYENIIAYTGIYVLVLGITLRPWTTLILSQIIVLDFFIANSIKISLLMNPLTAHDLIFFSKNLASNIPVATAYPELIFVSLVALAIHVTAIVFFLKKERPLFYFSNNFGLNQLGRITLGLFSAGLVVAAWATFLATTDHIPKRIIDYGINDRNVADQFIFETTGKEPAYLVNAAPVIANTPSGEEGFLGSFWKLKIYNPDSPKGEKKMAQVIQETKPSYTSEKYPDICAVLQESQADLSSIGITPSVLLPQPLAPLPKWNGQTQVHTFGGGTYLSEFSFLTGFAWGDFGLAGSYAPYTLSPLMKGSHPRRMRELGYRTVAIYPVDGSFINAEQAYKNYGFEEFYAVGDLGISTNWTDSRVPDGDLFDAVVKFLTQKKSDSRPLFVFILTVKNHGPHPRKSGNSYNCIPSKLPEETSEKIAGFLDGYVAAELAIHKLSQTWLHSSRPRLLVSFGDHWPSLEGNTKVIAQTLNLNNQDIYTTPARMWANYEIKATFPHKMDLAFLGTATMEAAELPLDSFNTANRALRLRTEGKYAAAEDQQLVEGYVAYARDVTHTWNPAQ